ncbi:uncharacterized protein [Fopius arisanus]|uniref:Uncharacterized protein n=1 Tax=Fopius arisanus TaxID=64838 RepID=A0A9R1SYI5_9HYME|nr:PREDICTED: uncharacterized protein LOC105264358 [Fopius arisanus]
MGVSDTLNYVLFSNAVCTNAASFAKTAASAVINYSGLKPRVEYKLVPPEPLWKSAVASGPYLKLAGLSGATAVILGAYGAHRKYKDDQLKQVFETANRYDFYHSLAMVGLVACRAILTNSDCCPVDVRISNVLWEFPFDWPLWKWDCY